MVVMVCVVRGAWLWLAVMTMWRSASLAWSSSEQNTRINTIPIWPMPTSVEYGMNEHYTLAVPKDLAVAVVRNYPDSASILNSGISKFRNTIHLLHHQIEMVEDELTGKAAGTLSFLRGLRVSVESGDDRVIAVAIAIGVGFHVGSHLTCDFPRLLHATDKEYEPMKPFFGHERPPNYWWFVKGVEGVTGIVMVVLMAIAFVLATPWFRRNKINLPKPLKRLTGFNAFWYSHHLFVIVYVLLIIHGIFLYLSHKWYKKMTWMYLAVPMLFYGGERILRALKSGYKSVKLIKVAIYPDNVLALHVSKP